VDKVVWGRGKGAPGKKKTSQVSMGAGTQKRGDRTIWSRMRKGKEDTCREGGGEKTVSFWRIEHRASKDRREMK